MRVFLTFILILLVVSCARAEGTQIRHISDPRGILADDASGYTQGHTSEDGSRWVRTWGEDGGHMVQGLARNSMGNTYVAGYFMGQFSSEWESQESEPPEDYEIYSSITRYDSSGALLWSRRITFGENANIADIAVDDSDHLYVTGTFDDMCEFVFRDSVVTATSNGELDAFLCKLDPNANLLWFKHWGGTLYDQPSAMAIDNEQRILIVGGVMTVSESSPGPPSLVPPHQDVEAFLSMFSPAGELLWSRILEGSERNDANEVESDSDGNIYITGNFRERVDFDPGPASEDVSSSGEFDIYLSKYDSAGQFQWVQTWGGPNTDWGIGLATDCSGNVLVLGSIDHSVPRPVRQGSLNRPDHLALRKFSSSGEVLGEAAWEIFGLPSNTDIEIDNQSRVYVTGEFYGTRDIDPGDGTELFDLEGFNAFLLRLDSDLQFEWVRAWGRGRNISAVEVIVDNQGSIFVAGTFLDVADFDPGLAEKLVESRGWQNLYLSKFSSDGVLLSPISLQGDAPIWDPIIEIEYLGISDGPPAIGVTSISPGPGYAVISYPTATDPQGDAVRYDIYYIDSIHGDDPFDSPGRVRIGDAGESQYTVRGLEPGHTYRFGVRASDEEGNSDSNTEILSAEILVDWPSGGSWVRSWGGDGFDQANDVSLDESGNIYVSGIFRGTVDFDPGTGVETRTSRQSSEFYLAKFDESGSLLWVRAWERSAEAEIEARCMSDVDSFGNSYVTGSFKGAVDFDPGPGVIELSSGEGFGAFVCKFNPGGMLLWAELIGGSGCASPRSLAVGNQGDVLILGTSYGEIDFNPSPAKQWTETSELAAGFLVKLDAGGNFEWVGTWEPLDQAANLTRVATDFEGNVLVIGSYVTAIDLDPGPETDIHSVSETGIERDILLCKLDSEGNYQWGHTWGHSHLMGLYGLTVDGSSNIYITGGYRETVDIDPGSGIAEHTSNGLLDAFLCKFNSNGEFLWGNTWGGEGFDEGHEVDVDGGGNVRVAGRFSETTDFDSGNGILQLASTRSHNTFLSSFDSDGEFLGVVIWDWVSIYGMDSDSDGGTLITGRFDRTVELGAGATTQFFVSNGRFDAYLMKVAP